MLSRETAAQTGEKKPNLHNIYSRSVAKLGLSLIPVSVAHEVEHCTCCGYRYKL